MVVCGPEAVDLERVRPERRFVSRDLVAKLLDPLGTRTAPADGIEVFIALAATRGAGVITGPANYFARSGGRALALIGAS